MHTSYSNYSKLGAAANFHGVLVVGLLCFIGDTLVVEIILVRTMNKTHVCSFHIDSLSVSASH